MGGDFGAVPVAGTVVVAVVERLGGTVELTFRDEGGRDRRVAFVLVAKGQLDVVLSGVAVSAQDPWIGAVCAALGEDPGGYRCFSLLDRAGLARFRMVARDATWL